MVEISIEVPDGLRLSADEIRAAAAVKLYEIGRLSSGSAAALACVPRTLFLSMLADYGVATFNLSEQELSRELLSNGNNLRQEES